jgi:hypothetical protein
MVQEKIGGAPAVLFDSVSLLLADNKDHFMEHPKVHEFIRDAYLNYKFIGYTKTSQTIFSKVNIILDIGFIEFTDEQSVLNFTQASRKLRFWDRELII